MRISPTPSTSSWSRRVYVGPFARLLAEPRRARSHVGAESNVQDSVIVNAVVDRTAREQRRIARARARAGHRGPASASSWPTARRCTARAQLGVLAEGEEGPEDDSGVFVSFGARVDGAVIERDSGLSALSRVGPGVRLRSGTIVLPGKDVQTQREADDPALGKVRPITEPPTGCSTPASSRSTSAWRASTAGLAARGRRRRARHQRRPRRQRLRRVSATRPTVESALCTGPEVRDPAFRNRIIGNACFEDSRARLDEVLGERISVRADEGGPFGLGPITSMGDKVVFHALEGTDLRVGSRVTYGDRRDRARRWSPRGRPDHRAWPRPP